MQLTRRNHLRTWFLAVGDAANGGKGIQTLLEGLADSVFPTNAEAAPMSNATSKATISPLEAKLATANASHAVAMSRRDLDSYNDAISEWQNFFDYSQNLVAPVQDVERKTFLNAQATALMNQTLLSWEIGAHLKNRELYKNAIKYGKSGIEFIEATKVKPNFRNDLHLYVARASERVGKVEDMFFHYFKSLVTSGHEPGGVKQGALNDLYGRNYPRAHLRALQYAMGRLPPEERSQVREMLLSHSVGLYLGSGPETKSESASRAKILNKVYGIARDGSQRDSVKRIVYERVEKVAKNSDSLVDRNISTVPARFAGLEGNNPIIVHVHSAIREYFSPRR